MSPETAAHETAPSSEDFVALMESLRVDPLGDGRFVARPRDRGGVIDAGSLSALVTAATASPVDEVRAVHADFFRAAAPGQPVDIEVREMHRGRNLGLDIVTLTQAGRPLAAAQVSRGPTVDDLLAHALPVDLSDTSPTTARPSERYGPHARIAGVANPFEPESTHPPRWQVWVNCAEASGCGTSVQSVIAFHANQYVVSAAVLPHRGFSMHDAHRGVLTVITSSTVTFHRPVGSDWLLFDQTSTHAGGGWLYGRGEAFTDSGDLVASFTQTAIMRRAPAPRP